MDIGTMNILKRTLVDISERRKLVYRPQYLEQQYETFNVYSADSLCLSIRKPLKRNTWKRKENQEIVHYRGRKRVYAKA